MRSEKVGYAGIDVAGEPGIRGLRAVAKRGMDLVGAAVGLVVAAPIMAVIVVMIRLDSPGPVLFVQERVGRQGRPFRIFKFRTMVANAESLLDELVDVKGLEQPMFKLKDDPRVTRVGHWLRRASLDELPQFVNVLRGEMSLVGPRPEEKRFVDRYEPWQRERLRVKPGMTGPMQIWGRGDLSMEQRVRLEIEYIENYSLLLDVRILLRTLPAVLSAYGAY
jgi:exopolysaccharide biosynthesis polyprenyl glycosylphosphotransferase